MGMNYMVVLVTASSKAQARSIAEALIDSGDAACVNIVPKIESVFMWKKNKEFAEEHLLIVKTKSNRFQKLKQRVKKLHSYTVPEIIGIPIVKGEKKYLDWISEVVK